MNADVKFAKRVLIEISEDELIEQAMGVWRRHAHLTPSEQMGITLVVACHAAINAALGRSSNDLDAIPMAGEA